MKCNFCGQMQPDDSLFCQNCGNKIENSDFGKGKRVAGILARKTKDKFCKHCGTRLETEKTYCQSCGKWFFAFRKKYIVYATFVLLILLFSLTTTNLYIKYTESSKEIDNWISENQRLKDKVEELEEEVSSEYTKGYDDGYAKGKAHTSSRVKASPSISELLTKCIIASCNNQRAGDFCYYCLNHKCVISDCDNSKTYNSNYCFMHK